MSEQEAERAVDRGADAATTLQEKINGVPLSVLNAYRDVEAKYHDVQKLQKGVLELRQLFQDMSVLVEQQGEMLDQIEINIQTTADTTTKANEALTDTRKYVRQLSKWRSICLCITVCIILFMLQGLILRG